MKNIDNVNEDKINIQKINKTKKNKNCLNCGSPIDYSLSKCPYCGTQYYDCSFLDIDNTGPFVMNIRTQMNGKKVLISQLVRVEHSPHMELCHEETTVHSGHGNNPILHFTNSVTTRTTVDFIAIPDDGRYCTITIEEE